MPNTFMLVGAALLACDPSPDRDGNGVVSRDCAVRQWIDDLSSNDFNTRDRATRHLAVAGAPAARWLVEAADGDDPEVTVRVLRILLRMSVVDEDGDRRAAIAALETLSRSECAAVAQRADPAFRSARLRYVAPIQWAGGKVETADDDDGRVVSVDLNRRPCGRDVFARLRSLHDLERLNLEATGVSDAELRHLAGLTRLHAVYLTDTSVGDEGLAQLSGLKNLRVLWLSRTRVTDAGLDHLESLAGLRHLHVSGTAVTEEGARKLQQAIPGLRIVR